MRILASVCLLLLLASFHGHGADFEKVTFDAADGLSVTADLYVQHPETNPFIVFFHQAGWSRGEYRPIVQSFLDMGFNCMAVDQRSGAKINDVVNETAGRASEAGLGTTFVDAIPDMKAAILYARAHYAKGRLAIWGSSYSAALVLHIAHEFPRDVHVVLSFSPGEYFTRFGKSASFVTDAAAKMTQAAFITSAQNEQQQWQGIYDAIPHKEKSFFLPETAGNHGSRALWQSFADSDAYMSAVKEFLAKQFPEIAK